MEKYKARDWFATFNEITHDFSTELNRLNDEQVIWQPTTDAWSIAYQVGHMIILNDFTLDSINKVCEETRVKLKLKKSSKNSLKRLSGLLTTKTSKNHYSPLAIQTFVSQKGISTVMQEKFQQHQHRILDEVVNAMDFFVNVPNQIQNEKYLLKEKLRIAMEILVKRETRYLINTKNTYNSLLKYALNQG